MKKQFRNILLALALIFLVLFMIFMINQTASIVTLAKEYNPYFGSILLYGLLLIYAALFVFPIVYILKMPSALHPPENENSPIHLYGSVAAMTFSVGSVEKLDLEKQIEPIITPLISGSVIGGIPGTSGLTTFMTTSIVEGAANALLTLRVGITTRKCFGIESSPSPEEVRRSAIQEAGSMLGAIVAKSAGCVTKAIIKASKKRVSVVGESLKETAIKSAGKMTVASKQSASTVFDFLRKPKK